MRRATILPGLFLMACSAAWGQSHWTWRNPTPQGNALRSVVWADSQSVAVGDGGTILTSPDGSAWTLRTSGTFSPLYTVAWTGTQWVAAGESGAILTSPDGVTWASRTSGTSARIVSLCWAGTQIVAVGNSGTILTSPDGVTWTARKVNGSYNLLSVAWTGSVAVAVGSDGQGNSAVFTSPDGADWILRYSGAGNRLRSALWTGTQILVLGDTVLSSYDGKSWARDPNGFPPLVNGIRAGPRLIALGLDNQVYSSQDGKTWTYKGFGFGSGFGIALAWTGSELIAVGDAGAILTSRDAISWTSINHLQPWQVLRSVAWSGSLLVAVGDSGTILTSPDGVLWTPRSSGTKENLYTVVHGGSLLVAFGSYFTLTSPDGITWSRHDQKSDPGAHCAAWMGNQFVTGGLGIYTSTDGINWNQRSDASGELVDNIACSESRCVAIAYRFPQDRTPGGRYDTAFVSSDGISWTPHALDGSTAYVARSIAWTGSQFVVTGVNDTKVMTSPDGVNWTGDASINILNKHPVDIELVAANGAQLVGVGRDGGSGDLFWTSPDGVNWNPVQPFLGYTTSLIWTGTQFVAVGSVILTSQGDPVAIRPPSPPGRASPSLKRSPFLSWGKAAYDIRGRVRDIPPGNN